MVSVLNRGVGRTDFAAISSFDRLRMRSAEIFGPSGTINGK